MQEIFEKIMERLKELGWAFGEYYPDGTEVNKRTRKSVAYDDVVEIVNQVAEEYVTDTNVGNNDDCCEWVRDNYEFDVYDTKCKNRHVFFEGSPSDNEYEFCPYCGKKINVVK